MIVSGQAGPYEMAIDAAHIYWTNTNSGEVMRANKDGSSPTVMVSGQSTLLRGVTVDDTTLYWSTYVNGQILSMPKGGGAATVLQSQSEVFTLLVHGGDLYWTIFSAGPGALRKAPLPSLSPVANVIASLPDRTGGLAIDGGYAYLTHAANAASVYRYDLATGATQTLASTGGYAVQLVLDGSYVYWGNGDNRVMRVVKDGSQPPQLLATVPGANSMGIAVDEACVYYADWSSGTVNVMPKP